MLSARRWAAPHGAAPRRRRLFGKEGPGVRKLGAISIGHISQRNELRIECLRLLAITRQLGGAGGTGEGAEAVRYPLERGLELHECSGGLVHFQKQLAQEFAHRYEPVLHRNVFLAGVLQVSGRAHGADRLGVPSLAACHPRSGRPALDLDLLRPVRVLRLAEGIAQRLLRRGALSQAIHVFERALALRETVNFPPIFRRCCVGLGIAYALSGRVTEALPLLERALELQRPSDKWAASSLLPVWLGEGYVLAGRLEAAMQLGQQALEATRTQKQQAYQAYALRLLGDIAAHRTPPAVEEAEHHYNQALALAEARGMRPLQAHCHLGLGTLYTMTDQRDQARAELSTAIEMYQTMEMTLWLPQAEAALAQVAPR